MSHAPQAVITSDFPRPAAWQPPPRAPNPQAGPASECPRAATAHVSFRVLRVSVCDSLIENVTLKDVRYIGKAPTFGKCEYTSGGKCEGTTNVCPPCFEDHSLRARRTTTHAPSRMWLRDSATGLKAADLNAKLGPRLAVSSSRETSVDLPRDWACNASASNGSRWDRANDDVADREELEKLAAAMGFPGWESKTNSKTGKTWLDPRSSFCEWLGLCCERDEEGRNRVTEIHLERNNLSGTFPSTFHQLSRVRASALPRPASPPLRPLSPLPRPCLAPASSLPRPCLASRPLSPPKPPLPCLPDPVLLLLLPAAP